ncbi:GHKL domain-containing protein [Biomaibacter acetigenes]|uniref:GHKL domain-containing protein n=1 Tax=Biomaibacter acetigenes TaxID=2316383 RepID=A0A3G2R442_9FIRM|nr:GHKL domain-containing protein [Biomaibacter acetigenes]
MDSFELSTVVGNVIDNAIEAVKERESNRIIYFEVAGKQKFYIVKISNNGSSIKEEILKKYMRRVIVQNIKIQEASAFI